MDDNFIKTPELKSSLDSIEAMFANKFKQDIEAGKIDMSLLNTDEAVKEALLRFRKHPKFKNVSLDGIVIELKNFGIIKPLIIEKKIKVKKEPEHIGIEVSKINLTKVEEDILKQRAIQNIEIEEKKKIFDNKELIDKLLVKAENILNFNTDPEEYVRAGIHTEKQMQDYLDNVKKALVFFKIKNTPEKEETRKITKIFEAILIDGTNKAECFGKNVILRSTFIVDDIGDPKIGGVDATLHLKNEDSKKEFVLGIDATICDIYGSEFKEKVLKICEGIKNGKNPEIKYLKDFNGNITTPKRVPKIIMSGEITLIKNLMHDFYNLDSQKLSEKLRTHAISFKIVNQVIKESKIFTKYAEDVGQQYIADSYNEISNIIEKIKKDLPSLRLLLTENMSDNVPQRIQDIVNEVSFSDKVKGIAA